jgi:hypothetical protein
MGEQTPLSFLPLPLAKEGGQGDGFFQEDTGVEVIKSLSISAVSSTGQALFQRETNNNLPPVPLFQRGMKIA